MALVNDPLLSRSAGRATKRTKKSCLTPTNCFVETPKVFVKNGPEIIFSQQ